MRSGAISNLFFLVSSWLLILPCHAESTSVLINDARFSFQTQDTVPLDKSWEFYPEQLLTPDSIDSGKERQFVSIPHTWTKQNIHHGTYRLKFQLLATTEELALYLGIIATAHRVWINGLEYGGRGQVTTSKEKSSGEIGTRLLAFGARPQNEIIIQVSTHKLFGGMVHVPILGPARILIPQQILIGVLQGLLQGFLLMMTTYHGLLYLMRKRERSHFFLALGCLGIFLRDSTVGRVIILQEVFAKVPIERHYDIQYVGAMLTTLGYFLFTHYLFPKAMRPWLVRTVVSLELTALCLTFLLPIDQRDIAAMVHLAGSLVAIVFGIIGIFRQVRQKEPYSLVFFCGIFVFCLFGLVDLFQVSRWDIPTLSLASTASCIFSFFQAALLAQKNAKAYRDLESEQSKNRHAYQELSKLVYPHQIKQLKNGEILEQTMPVGEADGVVLQFDIIDSSRLESSVAKAFFEKIFNRTNAIMMRDYDPDQLVANGFRIKELGDGFLCSVGFPFKTPQGILPEKLALQMAEEFVRVFQEEEAWLDHSVYGRLHCAIGIARGEISGYFPQAGIKNYDIFGSGVILATRYESIRKNLFANTDPTAIIIVQNRVFEALPATIQEMHREQYRIYDLSHSDFRVRNDPEATYFYVYTMESLESRRSA